MPASGAIGLLLAVSAVGAAIAALLVAATAGHQLASGILARSRARADQEARPYILRAVASRQLPPETLQARGRRGRAVDRVACRYLAQVRGEAHSLLAGLLEQRGTVARAVRAGHSRRAQTRARAAELLGTIASPATVECLEQLAGHDPNNRVRIVAVRALGETGTPGAAGTLLHALGRSNPSTVPPGIIESALLSLGAAALPTLREAAATGTPARRAAAVDLLGLLKDLPSWETVAAHLHSADVGIRLSAVRALGQLGVRRATGALVACLADDPEPGVQTAAAWALGRIRDPAAVPALRRCLAKPGYLLPHSAAEALGRLGRPGRRALTETVATGGMPAMHAREVLSRGPQAPDIRPPASMPPVLSRPRYFHTRALPGRPA